MLLKRVSHTIAIKTILIFSTQDIKCFRNITWHAKERNKENKLLCDCNQKTVSSQNNHFTYDLMFRKLHLIIKLVHRNQKLVDGVWPITGIIKLPELYHNYKTIMHEACFP